MRRNASSVSRIVAASLGRYAAMIADAGGKGRDGVSGIRMGLSAKKPSVQIITPVSSRAIATTT